jgi:hypothetical protein
MRRALNTSYDQYARNRKVRKHWGMPEEHIANTSMGRSWEEGVDDLMGMDNIKRARDYGNEVIREKNPWMKKLDPDSILYGIDDQVPNNLQLGHIMDVLREDLATGRMTPEDLKNVSMDRAVRRTHEYNQERAKAQESAQAKKLEGMTIHKEYPEGYKWVELNKPGQFAAESDAMGHSVRGYEPPINHPDWIKESGNAGSKSYGFGGWDAIKSGDAKIYSLIDKANRPHTTIEINKGYDAPSFYETNRNLLEDPRFKEDAEMWNNYADSPAIYVDEITKLFKEAGLKEGKDYTIPKAPKPSINQIKGKGNRAPNPEYLPYVQDFVRSGDWENDIGDLHYTGLKHLNEAFPDYEMKKYFNKTNPDQIYLTQKEIDDFTKEWNTPQGEKSGGVIKMGVGGLLKNAALIAAREEALASFLSLEKKLLLVSLLRLSIKRL